MTQPQTTRVEPQAARSSWRQRLEALFRQYGRVAVGTYFALFALTWSGFVVAIAAGVELDGAGSNAGTVAAAWLATKVTQPIRIAATLALTPLIARLVGRWAGGPRAEPSEDP